MWHVPIPKWVNIMSLITQSFVVPMYHLSDGGRYWCMISQHWVSSLWQCIIDTAMLQWGTCHWRRQQLIEPHYKLSMDYSVVRCCTGIKLMNIAAFQSAWLNVVTWYSGNSNGQVFLAASLRGCRYHVTRKSGVSYEGPRENATRKLLSWNLSLCKYACTIYVELTIMPLVITED